MNHDNKSEWNSSLAFLMSMIGAAVGLGNIWRFSYVLYLPAGTPALKLGTPVRVYSRQGNERVASGCVADFVSGPLGCKLWI